MSSVITESPNNLGADCLLCKLSSSGKPVGQAHDRAFCLEPQQYVRFGPYTPAVSTLGIVGAITAPGSINEPTKIFNDGTEKGPQIVVTHRYVRVELNSELLPYGVSVPLKYGSTVKYLDDGVVFLFFSWVKPACAIPVFYQERLNIQPQMTQDQSLVSGLNGSLQLSVSVPQPPQASQFLDEQEQYQGEVEIDLETFFYLDMPMYGSWIEEPRYGI